MGSRHKWAAATLVIAAMVLAACGGDDATDDFSGGDDDNSVGTTDTSLLTSPVQAIPGLSEGCAGLANLSLALTQAVSGNTAGAAELMDAASAGLPAELSGDIAVMRDAVDKMARVMDELDLDLTDPNSFAALTEEQLETFDDAFSTDEADAAFDRLSDWAEANCAVSR